MNKKTLGAGFFLRPMFDFLALTLLWCVPRSYSCLNILCELLWSCATSDQLLEARLQDI
jgi:hypothetical protein